ncbi:hypothetical protein [Methylobacterium sp. XJLW]|uniref:hypothetical protein n=1 Tax=Methylobacterium sp. XJLW TaxID=739141 RepID=UPI0013E05CB7|nr:hypothetical protein [Methylobacterium sp. XJLW]
MTPQGGDAIAELERAEVKPTLGRVVVLDEAGERKEFLAQLARLIATPVKGATT